MDEIGKLASNIRECRICTLNNCSRSCQYYSSLEKLVDFAKNEKQIKIDRPTEEEYNKRRVQLAFSYAPPIKKCKKCGWPYADGYCCPTCKTDTPDGDDY